MSNPLTAAELARAGRVSLLVCLLCSLSHGQPQKSVATKHTRAESLATMRAVVDSWQIEVGQQKIERLAEPIYRFTDSDRKFDDGTIWVWGKTGRPAAIATVAEDGQPNTVVTETVVLSDDVFMLTIDAGEQEYRSERSTDAGFTARRMKTVPNYQSLHKSPTRLKSQAKLLARKFSAFEIWNNDNKTEEQRYQLRLLPNPIHEYSDDSKGIRHGSIFLLSYGSNPELAMILEATEDGWRCGFGRLGHAKAEVKYNKHTFYAHAWFDGGGEQPLYLFRNLPRPAASAVSQTIDSSGESR